MFRRIGEHSDQMRCIIGPLLSVTCSHICGLVTNLAAFGVLQATDAKDHVVLDDESVLLRQCETKHASRRSLDVS